MSEGPARRERTGDVDAESIGAQATLRSSDIRRPAGDAPVGASPEGAPGTLEIGTKLEGVYEVKSLLGRGAMGAVYLVEHTGLGKQFAAKVVGGSRALDAAAVARLRNEARIASSIEHENIVNVTHLGQTGDGTVFIVMELLRGEDLRHRMERQLDGVAGGGTPWLPDVEVRDIVTAVLGGLSAAHGAGVVHRDLKPDNIFLAQIRQKTKPKLVDFGIGKLRAGEQANLRLTETGQIIGTPLYMAPEQTRSTSNVDHRADLYSLGVMIFEMVCGRPPFDAGHLFEIVVKHATEAPPDPRTFRPDLPVSVAEFTLRCLRKEPDERFASADEMLEAWTAAWSAAGVHSASSRPSAASGAAPVSVPRHTPPPADGAAAAGSDTGTGPTPSASAGATTPVPAPSGPSRGLVVGGGVAAVSVAVALVFALAGGSGEPTSGSALDDVDLPVPPPPPADERPSADEPPTLVEPPPAADPGPDPSVPLGVEPPAARRHTITSTPSGAEIVRDGAVLGVTPYELEVPAGTTTAIQVRMEGYRSAERTIGPEAEPTIDVRLRPRSSGGSSGGSGGGDWPGLAPH